MKVIICGDRKYEDYNILCEAIEKSGFKIKEVVSGGAKGVDALGERWAKENKKKVKKFPADWKNLDTPGAIVKQGDWGEYNARAGMDRNIQMAEYADGCIALFSGSSGTANMIDEAKKRDLEVYVYEIVDENDGLIPF